MATESPDFDRRSTLFSRIPEVLDEGNRKRRYDLPIQQALLAEGIAFSLRGFTLSRTENNHSPGVGIEVRGESADALGLVVQLLADLGAPLETAIEIVSEKGTVSFTLAEATA